MVNELLKKVREVTDEDRKGLPSISYSKLDNFKKCALSHKFKYIDGYYPRISSLAMDIGSIAHKGLEIKGQNKIEGKDVDYEEIKKVVINGCDEETAKRKTHILGTDELRKKYFEEFYATDSKSGMTYDQKLLIYFDNVLLERMEDPEWNVEAVELPFEFVYDDRVIVHGFIDRVDSRVNKSGEVEYRIIDYKTSKAVFRDADIKTPLQHVIYDLGCLFTYGVIPKDHIYDFIFLNQIQGAAEGVCTKGYLKRGIKKINKLLDQIDEMDKSGEYPPNPNVLCYWCPYHSTSPHADPKYKGMCQYHSLWTPENRTFQTLSPKDVTETKRKLIF